MDKNKLFTDKLYAIRRLIYGGTDCKVVGGELDQLYHWLQGKYSGLDLFKRIDEVADELLSERVLRDESYTESFLKDFLNFYFSKVETELYDAWGIVFAKIFSGERAVIYPGIYAAFFRIYLQQLPELYEVDELIFPLSRELNLFKLFGSWKPVIEEIFFHSSTYTLLFDSLLRNSLVLYLYEQYKEEKPLNIWFPFAGNGIEPLLISYLLHLIHEVESGEKRFKKLAIFCSDHTPELLKRGLNLGPLDNFIGRTKEDFAHENGLKLKEIGASRGAAKRVLHLVEADFEGTLKLPADSFSIVIINSVKYSGREMIERLFDHFRELNRDLQLIVELESESEPELKDFNFGGQRAVELLGSRFVSGERRDYYQSYLRFELYADTEPVEVKEDSLEELFRIGPTLDKRELKARLEGLDKSCLRESLSYLHYASLLARAKMFKRSYELIRDHYEADYNLSYKSLKAIIRYCKNEKIVKRVETFIIEKQIKEKGFSAELLDAISGEIDRFYAEYGEPGEVDDEDELTWL